MANFGMIDRSVAFNPISAFPLDARSYFESYADALAAAQIASTVGDTNTQYYYGETVVVVENGAAQLYIIQPDKTLVEVGSKIIVDENAFELDEDGSLKLLGLEEAEEGAQLVKSKDGNLIWVKPDITTIEGLAGVLDTLEEELEKTNGAIDDANAEIEKLNQALNPTDEDGNPVEGGLVSEVKDLENVVGEEAVYDENGELVSEATGIFKDIEDIEDKIGDPANSELNQEATGLYAALELKADKATTYTKTEVDTLIEEKIVAADHLRRVIVDNKEAINANADDALLYIYMVPSGLEEDDNKYYEYIVLEADDGSRSVERVGSWEVNLDAYALKTEVSSLADVVATNKTAAEKAIAAEQARAEKAEADLAQDIIDAVNAEKERAEEAEQDLIDDLVALDEAKANKADVYTKTEVYNKSEVYTKGEADQAIADKISEVNGGESAGEVLAQLNAYKKIVNMEVWGDDNGAGDENGNSRIDNLVAQVQTLVNAKPFIDSVDSNFQVIDGQLVLKELPISKIEGLQNMSNDISVVQGKVGSLEDILNGYVDEETSEEVPGLVAEVQAIKTNYLTIVDFNAAVGNLESLLAETTTIVDRLETIEEVLKWQEMPNPTT